MFFGWTALITNLFKVPSSIDRINEKEAWQCHWLRESRASCYHGYRKPRCHTNNGGGVQSSHAYWSTFVIIGYYRRPSSLIDPVRTNFLFQQPVMMPLSHSGSRNNWSIEPLLHTSLIKSRWWHGRKVRSEYRYVAEALSQNRGFQIMVAKCVSCQDSMHVATLDEIVCAIGDRASASKCTGWPHHLDNFFHFLFHIPAIDAANHNPLRMLSPCCVRTKGEGFSFFLPHGRGSCR